MQEILQRIQEFADASHGNQLRKYTPDRYIVHPICVMKTCRLYEPRLPVLAAALLHDVLEDTPVTEAELLNFLNTHMDANQAQETLSLVVELTDVYIKVAYPKLNRNERKALEIKRISNISPVAQTIKYADILDNSAEIAFQAADFAPRYLKECLAILKSADKGNSDLRKKAIEVVRLGLASSKNEV